MRLFTYTGLLSVMLMLLSACTNIQYADDYKSGTDFSGLKTYNWRAISVDIGGIDKTVLQKIADEQLHAQGFILADTSAELLIDMQVFSRVSKGGNTSIGIGIGLPVGRNGSIGLGTGQTLGKGKQEGVIVIDITQTSSNQLIWRGNAEGIPLIHFSLKAEQKLRETFNKLLTPFPPQTAAQ
ncbi:DUF4136 domain-containing protein [Cellvibrio sp. OA-2007]|uniref:DUF4136 domain-containing protein n=1 Tax=Cellvibrio sp. OA-2007 TaxID=529823 RepID=UPI000781699B|nr:DUF4136 domain-containing protein [Cellvibrio sp. OA-2007]